MTDSELMAAILSFASKNVGKAQYFEFFRELHKLALRGIGVGASGGFHDSGEDNALSYIAKSLNERVTSGALTVFDVGANVGGFTDMVLTTFTGLALDVHCFEPSATTYSALHQRHGNKGNIRLSKLGLGQHDETLQLYYGNPGSDLASVFSRPVFGLNVGFETVQLTTIDSYCAQQGIQRIHLLKLDVEGNELNCLKGARKLIQARGIDFILFEFGGTDVDARIFFRDFWLELKDYSISRLLRDGFGLVQQWSEDEEIFGYQNYLAELRPA